MQSTWLCYHHLWNSIYKLFNLLAYRIYYSLHWVYIIKEWITLQEKKAPSPHFVVDNIWHVRLIIIGWASCSSFVYAIRSFCTIRGKKKKNVDHHLNVSMPCFEKISIWYRVVMLFYFFQISSQKKFPSCNLNYLCSKSQTKSITKYRRNEEE